ncbi:MAG: NADH:flavin oxidoreductase [candidate division KSB1 bacterium]|nr:NADH:flavin oxidoreductase [candidate division KSB1 bacterium]
MSRYFHFKSLEALRREVRRLNLSVEFEASLRMLLEPVAVLDRRVGNALVIHPMEGCDGTPDGLPDELTFRRYHRFATGGAKLIWCEATAVTEDGRANPRQLWLHDRATDTFARLVDDMRRLHRERFGNADDLLIGLQLTHSGRWSHPRPVLAVHDPLIDRVTFLRKNNQKAPLPADYPLISDDDLKRLEDRFVAAAARAYRAGFDFVDIKQCHTYLLNELLGARTRPGIYGGPWENRIRFITNVVRKIRDRVPGLHVATRVNLYDGVSPDAAANGTPDIRNGFGIDPAHPHQPDLREPIALIRTLVEHGVTLFNLTLGSPYYNPHLGRPFEKPAPDMRPTPEHPLIGVDRHFRLAAAVKQAVPNATFVGTGYSYLRQFFPHAAEANLRRRRIDLVGVGRMALAYPDFAADLLENGRLDPRRVCLTVSFCTALMRRKDNQLGQFPTGCVPRDALYAQIYRSLPRRS